MTDTIKPALTPQEWKVEMIERGTAYEPEFCVLVPEGQIHSHSMRVVDPDGTVIISKENVHALAALALYNQRFGFTRKDVDELRWLLKLGRLIPPYLQTIADRIAALLPPEEI